MRAELRMEHIAMDVNEGEQWTVNQLLSLVKASNTEKLQCPKVDRLRQR